LKPQISDDQKAQAFDSYIKKVLKYAARDFYEEKRKSRERGISLSELNGAELTELAVTDIYFADEYAFDVLGWRVGVSDYELGEALNRLPADRRNIILLSYFLDMTDREIGKRLNLIRSTVQYKRTSTLKELKKRLEENADE
jgi:DNA-directed RNA polymerase specialized sigma24 family protein